jgi:hypothetical protein
MSIPGVPSLRSLRVGRIGWLEWMLLVSLAVSAPACVLLGGPAPQATVTPPVPQAGPEAGPVTPGPGQLAPISEGDVVWHTSFETGDLGDLQIHGDFVRQGDGQFYLVTPHAHTGKYSVALTIDTRAWSSTGAHAAYLFYWDQLPEDGYYYSAWYYVPSGVVPHDWWNVWQWKSTYDGNTDNSWPVFVLDIQRRSQDLALTLIHKLPGQEPTTHTQRLASVPTDRWFHIEAFYRRATDETGQVIVWQDDQEIFSISNVQTTLDDNTIYWSINNYTDRIEPDPCRIYVDDMAISRTRIGDRGMP